MIVKILHTADMHLDSSMSSYLPRDKARERKNELLIAFENMVKYAAEQGIHHILVAGDMFDKRVITEKAVRFVERVITAYPDINFYYLLGNHDSDGFIERIDVPANLLTFGRDEWKKYTIPSEDGKNICIYGTELMPETQARLLTTLQPEVQDINIVMLHGQEYDYAGKDKEVRIDMPRLKGKAIDYLALGHVHAPKTAVLDARGVYSYPGCLEGRGFDECGEHGFNVLTVDTLSGETDTAFIRNSIRETREERIDISGAFSTLEALDMVKRQISDALQQGTIHAGDLVKLVLTGGLAVDAEIDAELIAKKMEDGFYFVKCVDETGRIIDYNAFRNDMSLKGEFVRQVQKDDSLSEVEKAEIIRTGILLLAGRKEEV